MSLPNATYRRLASLLLAFSLTGCAAHLLDADNPTVVSEAVTVERDPFKGTVVYKGPSITNRHDDGSGAPEVEEVYLHARTEKDKPTRFFLNVIDYYEGDWRGFDQAFDQEGRKFHALAVRHKVNCALFCGFDEVLEIELSAGYLKDHTSTGIVMRLYGPAGAASAAFALPAGYVQGFLQGAYAR
jgi:hypothetical protein